MKILYMAAGIANFVAIANLPYGYYEMLRWLVTIAAIVLIVQSSGEGTRAWLFFALPALALWNPFFGATMEKSSWLLFNIAAGVSFIAAARSKALFRKS